MVDGGGAAIRGQRWCVSCSSARGASLLGGPCGYSVGTEVLWRRSNAPPTQMVSRRSAVLVCNVPLDCVDDEVLQLGLLGDASVYAVGTQVPWRRLGLARPLTVPPGAGLVSRRCAVLVCEVPLDYVDGAVLWFGPAGQCWSSPMVLFVVFSFLVLHVMCVVGWRAFFCLPLLPCVHCTSGSLEPILRGCKAL